MRPRRCTSLPPEISSGAAWSTDRADFMFCTVSLGAVVGVVSRRSRSWFLCRGIRRHGAVPFSWCLAPCIVLGPCRGICLVAVITPSHVLVHQTRGTSEVTEGILHVLVRAVPPSAFLGTAADRIRRAARPTRGGSRHTQVEDWSVAV